MPQPRLTTPRLTLVPLAPRHLPYQIELNSDPVVLRYLLPRAATVPEIEAMHQRWLAKSARGDGLGVWAGFRAQSGAEPNRDDGGGQDDGEEFVGMWQLQRAFDHPGGEELPGQAELGYRLLRRHWRQGYASEGSRELLRYGFAELGLHRVVAHTMAVNVASRATMVSVGMRFVRSFDEVFEEEVAGHEQGEVEYEVLRADAPIG